MPKTTDSDESYQTDDSGNSACSRPDASTSTCSCQLASLFSIVCTVVFILADKESPDPLNICYQWQRRNYIQPEVERIQISFLNPRIDADFDYENSEYDTRDNIESFVCGLWEEGDFDVVSEKSIQSHQCNSQSNSPVVHEIGHLWFLIHHAELFSLLLYFFSFFKSLLAFVKGHSLLSNCSLRAKCFLSLSWTGFRLVWFLVFLCTLPTLIHWQISVTLFIRRLLAAAVFLWPQLRMLAHLILEYDFSLIRVI